MFESVPVLFRQTFGFDFGFGFGFAEAGEVGRDLIRGNCTWRKIKTSALKESWFAGEIYWIGLKERACT